MNARTDFHALALLDEPTREALYRLVGSKREVSRDQAAAELGIPREKAAFHLDRLVDGGLLRVSYRRPEGKAGPGAGRPTKLYRRSGTALSASVPARQYGLAGEVLSDALGHLPRDVAAGAVTEAAKRKGSEVAAAFAAETPEAGIVALLDAFGFEPQQQPEGDVILQNCPFHELTRDFAPQTCSMNKAFIDAAVNALADTRYDAELNPHAGRCCVRLRPRASTP